MNRHEERAWEILVELGAREWELGGKPALDLRTVRYRIGRSEKAWSMFLGAVLEVCGHSGSVRRHVDRSGNAVFVVRDVESSVRAAGSP